MEEEEGKAEGGIPNSGSSEQGGPWELRDPEGMLLADQDLVLLGEGWKVATPIEVLSMVAFVTTWSWVVATEALWLTKLKIFTI